MNVITTSEKRDHELETAEKGILEGLERRKGEKCCNYINLRERD